MPARVATTEPRLATVLVLATVLAIPFVFFSAFHGMPWFDDEGTLMIGFRSWRDGYRMYDQIYSLYGPLYNALYGLIYVVLHVPLTHTAGRLMASALWLGYTAGFAAFCYRVTRSMAATLVCYVLVLYWLAQLMDSPGHPEELCLLLLAITLLLASTVERARGAVFPASIGVVVAAMVLVKINVGAIVGGALLLALLRATVPGIWTRLAVPVVAAALLLMPLALATLLLDFVWVRYYCCFATLVIAAALLMFLNAPLPATLRPRDWWIIVGGGGLTAVISVGGMMLAGSSARAILDATVLQNAHFILNWYVPIHLPGYALALSVISALTALAYCLTSTWPRMEGWRQAGIVTVKIGFLLVAALLFAWPGRLDQTSRHVFEILLPFCWVIMVPSYGVSRPNDLARGAAGLMCATMSLYSFPVAGEQLYIAALLPVVTVPVVAHDLLATLRNHTAGKLPPAWRRSGFVAVAIVLAVGAAITARSARAYWHAEPLGFPGTALIRVDATRADDLRWIDRQLSSCTSSYTMPGLLSFAFWTGHFPPTALNINDVLAFIKPAQQQDIVQALSREQDLCVLYVPAYLKAFDRGQIKADPPLLHYFRTAFVPTAEHDGFVILKHSSKFLIGHSGA